MIWYKISSAGIDKIEGGSEFSQNNRFAGINISASGTNVITLGDGNVVNASFMELREALDRLKNSLVQSEKIGEKEKLDVAADIESIKDQLAKNVPNKTVIGKLWEQIEKVSTVSGIVDLIRIIAPLITEAIK